MKQDKRRRRCLLFLGPEENHSIERRRASVLNKNYRAEGIT